MNGRTAGKHLTVYRGAVAAGATNTSINIINSGGDIVANNQYFPSEPGSIIFGVAFGTNLRDPRVATPSLREIGPNYIRPFSVASPLGNDFNAYNIVDNPLPFKANENLDVQASSDDVGSQTMTVLLGLQFFPRPAPRGGERRTIRVSATTTLVANTWTTLNLTWEQTLPPGQYEIVGMQMYSATGYAFRLILPNEYYRPGGPTNQSIGQKYPADLNMRNLGSWGRFQQTALPSIEMLATAGDTAEVGYMDVIKVA